MFTRRVSKKEIAAKITAPEVMRRQNKNMTLFDL
jgi:hypothetical protein